MQMNPGALIQQGGGGGLNPAVNPNMPSQYADPAFMQWAEENFPNEMAQTRQEYERSGGAGAPNINTNTGLMGTPQDLFMQWVEKTYPQELGELHQAYEQSQGGGGEQQQQPRQQQKQRRSGGFMNTIRQAHKNDPEQFYAILAQLAGGGSASDIAAVRQQFKENELAEESLAQRAASQQESLEYRRQAAEDKAEERRLYREQQRQDKQDKELRSTLEWAGRSKYAPDSATLYEAKIGRPITFEDIEDFTMFKGQEESKQIQRDRVFDEVDKLIEAGVADWSSSKPIADYVAANPEFEKILASMFAHAQDREGDYEQRLKMARERHDLSMKAGETALKRGTKVDRTKWSPYEIEKEKQLETFYKQEAAIVASFQKKLGDFSQAPLHKLAKQGGLFTTTLEEHTTAMDRMNDARDEWQEWLEQLRDKYEGEEEDIDTTAPTATTPTPTVEGRPTDWATMSVADKLAWIRKNKK